MLNSELVTFNDPKSPISEAFITLRTNIQFMNVNKKLNSLLVTSSLPGEGKSWVSANLAISFAQLGKKVLLIDADLRKGRIHEIFGIDKEPGLSNYLSETAEDVAGNKENFKKIIRETPEHNLFVIPVGTFPPNPSELLVSMQMKKLLEGLEENYDLVIIDGTPCELIADSKILSRIVDSTVVVAEYNKTKKDILKRALKGIRNVGGNIAGIIVNKVPHNSKSYYSDGYYYYGQNEEKKDFTGKAKSIFSNKIDTIKEKNKEKKLLREKERREELAIRKEEAELRAKEREAELIAKKQEAELRAKEKEAELEAKKQEAELRKKEREEKLKAIEEEQKRKAELRAKEEEEKLKAREEELRRKAEKKTKEEAEREEEKQLREQKKEETKKEIPKKIEKEKKNIFNFKSKFIGKIEISRKKDDKKDDKKHDIDIEINLPKHMLENDNANIEENNELEKTEAMEKDGEKQGELNDKEVEFEESEFKTLSDSSNPGSKRREIIDEINEYLNSKANKS